VLPPHGGVFWGGGLRGGGGGGVALLCVWGGGCSCTWYLDVVWGCWVSGGRLVRGWAGLVRPCCLLGRLVNSRRGVVWGPHPWVCGCVGMFCCGGAKMFVKGASVGVSGQPVLTQGGVFWGWGKFGVASGAMCLLGSWVPLVLPTLVSWLFGGSGVVCCTGLGHGSWVWGGLGFVEVFYVGGLWLCGGLGGGWGGGFLCLVLMLLGGAGLGWGGGVVFPWVGFGGYWGVWVTTL